MRERQLVSERNRNYPSVQNFSNQCLVFSILNFASFLNTAQLKRSVFVNQSSSAIGIRIGVRAREKSHHLSQIWCETVRNVYGQIFQIFFGAIWGLGSFRNVFAGRALFECRHHDVELPVAIKKFQRVPPLLIFFKKIFINKLSRGGGVLAFSPLPLDLTRRAWPPGPPPR